jgi:membrane protease YdiL (CAAX protease family)
MKARSFIRKFPIISFVLLTFFISHVLNPFIVELLHILFPSFSFDFPQGKLNERSLINQYGGTIAALTITILLYDTSGLQSTIRFSRINAQTVPWLSVSVLLPLFMVLLSYSLAGVPVATLLITLGVNWPFYLLIIGGFIISAGLAEEFGWRGFLLPQLLKTLSPLPATLVTFVIVSLWHFPALLSGWKGEPILPWVVLSLAIAVVHSWLFFKSKANLIVQILFHACFDAEYSFYSHFITDDHVPNTPFHQGWTYIISYCALALVIIVATKGCLGYDRFKLNLDKYFGEKKQRGTTAILQPRN